MRRRFSVMVLALGALSGCGYSTKSLYNKNYHTVAVPIFENKTFRREWEFRLTEAIAKNIEYRTPYKVAKQDKADTVLTGEVSSTCLLGMSPGKADGSQRTGSQETCLAPSSCFRTGCGGDRGRNRRGDKRSRAGARRMGTIFSPLRRACGSWKPTGERHA